MSFQINFQMNVFVCLIYYTLPRSQRKKKPFFLFVLFSTQPKKENKLPFPYVKAGLLNFMRAKLQ